MELRPWTLPNFLTFARLAALPFLVMAILDGRAWAALAIFLAAAVTDIVDGYVARRFGMGSPLGAWLDPIADKLFLVSTFVVFALPGTPTAVRIPVWLLVLTIFRDLYILVTASSSSSPSGSAPSRPRSSGSSRRSSRSRRSTAILLANVKRLQPVVATVCMGLVAVFATVSALHYTWRVLTGLPRGPHPPVAAPAA